MVKASFQTINTKLPFRCDSKRTSLCFICVCVFLSMCFCYKYFSNILLLLLLLCLVICIFGTYWLYASIYWRHAAIMDSAIRTARGWIVSILSSLSPSSNTNHKTFSCLLIFVFLCFAIAFLEDISCICFKSLSYHLFPPPKNQNIRVLAVSLYSFVCVSGFCIFGTHWLHLYRLYPVIALPPLNTEH